MAGSETERVNDSVVSAFLSKVGLVLSRVKDTMVADLLADLENSGLTWEQFQSECKKNNIACLDEFIDRIVSKLGFDLSAGSQKIRTVVKSLLTSSIKLGDLVRQLFEEGGGTDWAKLAESLLSSKGNGSGAPTDILQFSKELFSGSDLPKAAAASLEDAGGIGKKLKALIEAVQEVVSIIREFSSLEWESIADDAEHFGDYITNTYFTKAFGKRILDYVLLLLLKNAKEVFMEDILALATSAQSLVSLIREELADSPLAKDAMSLAEDILRYRQEVTGMQALVQQARKQFEKDARKFKQDAVFAVPLDLATRLEQAWKRLYALAAQAFPSYFSLATVFNRTYAILDLMGLIKEEEIPVPADAVENAKAWVRCLRWGKVEKIFTDPLDYLASTFAIYDLEDAETLLLKILGVARSFNDDIPTFSSIKQMVWELLIRIKDRLLDRVDPVAASMKADLERFRQFLENLLRSMEALAAQAKSEVTGLVDTFLKNGKSALADLKNTVGSVQKTVGDCIKPLTALVDGLPCDEFTDLFIDPLIDAVEEKAPQYLGAYSPGLIAGQVRKNLTDAVSSGNKDSIVEAVRKLMDDVSKDVKTAFSGKKWTNTYKEAVKDLKEEFEFQTRNVPSLDKIKSLAFKDYENPFSDLDIHAYADIIVKRLEGAVPFDPDRYGKQAEEMVGKVLAVDVFKGVADISAEGFKDDLAAMAQDVLVSWWSAVRQNLYNQIVRPVLKQIGKAVKEWWTKLLTGTIIPAVRKLVERWFEAGSELREFFGAASETALNLLLLVSDAKEINSWTDGLGFVVKVYRMIPASVKQSLGNLIDLPDFDLPALPDYTLDVENRFFAATVWDWSGAQASGSGAVSVQLVAFVAERSVDGKDRPGLYFFPVAKGAFGADINLGEEHHLVVSASTALNDGVTGDPTDDAAKRNLDGKLGFFIYPKESATDIRVLPLASSDSVTAFLSFLFSRGQTGGAAKPLTLLDADVVNITLGNYPQKVFIGYDHGFDVGYQGKIEDLKVRLKLRDMNEFFGAVLKNDIEVNLKELMLGYSLRKGFDIDGSVYAVIPIKSDIDLRVVHLNGVSLELGGKDGDLVTKLTTTFTVDLDCVTISFPEMGIGCSVNVLSPNGGVGTFDVKPKFQFPNGLGLSIDAEAVKGGGILQWEEDEGRFLAALNIEVVELFSASGLLLFTLGSPGKPFSMLAAISAFFTPGIQLGMGFSLTAVGGSLGINRRIDTDKMREAVKDGSLESVLFVKDLTGDNLTNVLSNVAVYFPQTNGQFFFGALAELTWAEIFKVDFGLFLQAPDPVTIIIAGGLHLNVADSAEKLLSLNAYFLGVIDFAKGLSFDAELVDTCLVGLEMYGSLALRILWGGDTKGFLLSAGGFHPQYTPEPGFNVGKMKRIGMKLDYKIVKFSLETYFAVTSNTVQFGADVQLKVGWDKFGLQGYFYFNTLFQFNPFAFLFDIGAGVAVKLGSVTLMSISLDLALGGPAPWHAKGKASFTILFIKIKVSFDQTWGKRQKVSESQYIDLLPVFAKGFAEPSNWSVISSDTLDNLVTILPYGGEGLMMNPSDVISFSQKEIPLDQMMDKYGEVATGDIDKLSLLRLGIATPDGYGETGTLWFNEEEYKANKQSFAPSMIRSMSQEDKLSSPSYEDMESGFALRGGAKVHQGPCKESGSEAEYLSDGVDWDKWASDADRIGKETGDTPAKWTQVQKAATAQTEKKEAKIRPSHHRSKVGFERFIRQMDQASVEKYERSLEKAKAVSNE